MSSPSGVGKTTIKRKLCSKHHDVEIVTSYTTRGPRPDEMNGVDYNFISEDIFNEMAKNTEFIEYENVHGNWYGTSVKDINRVWNKDKDAILEIDVYGAMKIKEICDGDCVAIFVLPPSIDELEKRIRNRMTETPITLRKRLSRSVMEFSEGKKFDRIITNESIESAVCAVDWARKGNPTTFVGINKFHDELIEESTRRYNRRKRVYVCSPFGGDIEGNTLKTLDYCKEEAYEGLSPYAPHLIYPRFLDDNKKEDRDLGISMGLSYIEACDFLRIRGNRVSTGMQMEIDLANKIGVPIDWSKFEGTKQ